MTFKTPNHCVYFNLKFPYRETLVYMAEQIKALKLQALRQTGMHKKTGMQLSFCGLEGNFFKAQWTPMSDSDQHFIPNSFTDLFKDPARPYAKASEPFAVVLERYDLCEDMAQMLYQPSLNMMGSLNITESDVIDRTLEGLLIIACASCCSGAMRIWPHFWTDNMRPSLQKAHGLKKTHEFFNLLLHRCFTGWGSFGRHARADGGQFLQCGDFAHPPDAHARGHA